MKAVERSSIDQRIDYRWIDLRTDQMCIRDRAITPPEVTAFAALPGHGLAAKLDGMDIYAGNAAFIPTKLTLPAALAQQADKLASEGLSLIPI